MPDPLKKNREKFYYNKTGIDIQNPVTPERSYEIPFELKRSVPTHISREVLLHITGFTLSLIHISFATGIPPNIYAFHRYTRNSTYPSGTLD